MHRRPGESEPGLARRSVEPGRERLHRFGERGDAGRSRFGKRGIGRIERIGAEHQAEQARALGGKGEVGAPAGDQPGGRVASGGHRHAQRLLEPPKRLHGERGEQAALVAEMRRGGRMRDADAAGEVTQRQRLGRRVGQRLGGGVEQGAAQRAVVVAVRRLGHEAHRGILGARGKLDNGQSVRHECHTTYHWSDGRGTRPLETLFSAASLLAIAGWVCLLAAPRNPLITWRLAGQAIPALLSLGYLALLVVHMPGASGGFSSLAGVRSLFETEGVLLAGWVHYLAFDLCLGAWMTRRAMAAGWPRWRAAICLPPTFLAGPVGLLVFFALGGARQPPEAAR